MNSYDIPAEAVSVSEETIKKSRFITFLAHTDGVQSAKEFVRQTKTEHPAARHHCWAWVAGAPDDSQQLGFSDDGEPSGTAGKPMLAQLQGSQIGEITAVVVRYYGGVQLGTGGLVKAYGGGVQQGLKQLVRKQKTVLHSFGLSCDYSQLVEVERLIQCFNGQFLSREYQDKVRLTLALSPVHLADFNQSLADLSRGSLFLSPE